jgi:hypothetical protein
MLTLLPDLFAIGVVVLIGTVIIGIPYSISVSLPRAFQRGFEESLNSVDSGAGTASSTGEGCHSSRDTHFGDPESEFDRTRRSSAILECRSDALAVLGVLTDATEAEIKAA